MLISLLLLLLVCALIWQFLLPLLPEPFRTIITIVLVVIVILRLLALGGYSVYPL